MENCPDAQTSLLHVPNPFLLYEFIVDFGLAGMIRPLRTTPYSPVLRRQGDLLQGVWSSMVFDDLQYAARGSESHRATTVR
jgi:hypothetical protein